MSGAAPRWSLRAASCCACHAAALPKPPLVRLLITRPPAGDVIVAVDGKPVRSLFDLSTLLDERSPGDTVQVKALRGVDQGGAAPEAVTVTATLEEEQA